MTSPEGGYTPNPKDHYERSYFLLAHAEVSSNADARNDLLLAAATEGIQGVLLAFLLSQPSQDNPEVPPPPPEEPPPPPAE